ncbi:MAG: hypothetical protein JWR82_1226 [Blastococcus sp.]|jgi:alkylation response protein AidB-like acyl-CoA dehydrogenase|nr:hypothetical protein [Blastococcus sp.]
MRVLGGDGRTCGNAVERTARDARIVEGTPQIR